MMRLTNYVGTLMLLMVGAVAVHGTLKQFDNHQPPIASWNLNVNRHALQLSSNPNPIVFSAGIHSWQWIGSSGLLLHCGDMELPNGSTIDLRQIGCNDFFSKTTTNRYYGQIEVENPNHKNLSYEWELFITPVGEVERVLYSSQGKQFVLQETVNKTTVTNDCRVAVTIIAPETNLSRTEDVWAGKCRYQKRLMRKIN